MGKASIWRDAVLFVMVTVALNGVVFGLGWQHNSGSQTSGPPGWLVGGVWVVLFALFGAAHALMRARGQTRWVWAMRGFALLCLAYPFYTGGLKSATIGLAGCLVSLVWAAALAWRAWPQSRTAGWLMLPSLVWLGYATDLILRQL